MTDTKHTPEWVQGETRDGLVIVSLQQIERWEREAAVTADLRAALERMEEQFRGRCTYPGDKDAILAARAALDKPRARR